MSLFLLLNLSGIVIESIKFISFTLFPKTLLIKASKFVFDISLVLVFATNLYFPTLLDAVGTFSSFILGCGIRW